MSKTNFYSVIDVGTSKIRTIIMRVGTDGEFKIVGSSVVGNQGMQKGKITDRSLIEESIKTSISQAARYLEGRPPPISIAISGINTSCTNTTGITYPKSLDRSISSKDLEDLVETSYPNPRQDQSVVHVIPISFLIDGSRAVRNPVGYHAGRLQVESYVVFGDQEQVNGLLEAVQSCGVRAKTLVLGSLAAANSALSRNEKELGSVLIDMGAGTTEIAVFKNGSLWYHSCLPIGGNQITNDLSVALDIPWEFAERVKVAWGHANPNSKQCESEGMVPSLNGRPRKDIRRSTVCRPIIDRLEETLGLCMLKIQNAGLDKMPIGGIVITGGVAATKGLDELAKTIFHCPVRIGTPSGIKGLSSELKQPSFSTVLGMLLWNLQPSPGVRNFINDSGRSWGHKALVSQLKKVMEVKT
jgi:cell division protein FtsA